MTAYLGDYAEDATLHHIWDSFAAAGASITRAVNGTISVYKDNGVAQSTAGITDTEDFDSLTGIHALTIDLSADAFYATGSNYSIVLSAATIDGQTVNAVLAHFSIQNRYNDVNVASIASGAITAAAIASNAITAAKISSNAITAAKIAANAITSSQLATDAISSDQLASAAVDKFTAAIKALVIESEGNITVGQALSVILAFSAGQSDGQDTSTAVFKSPNGVATRITGTTDGSGNRSAVTLTPSA